MKSDVQTRKPWKSKCAKEENHQKMLLYKTRKPPGKVGVQNKKTGRESKCAKQENHQEKWVCKAKTKTKTPGENI